MTKYLINRIIRSLISVALVVTIVMILIYSLMDRRLIFAKDPQWIKTSSNNRVVYELQQWEKYGYLDYIPYADFLKDLLKKGEIDQQTYDAVVKFGDTEEKDSELAAQYIQLFKDTYEKKGYSFQRLPADYRSNSRKYKEGGAPQIFVQRDIPITSRLWDYLTGIFTVDNIHYVEDELEDRGLTFTLYDPVYGGEKFSPAIIGNGTYHKYLLYFDNEFPYIHQNLLSIRIGTSYSIQKGVDVFDILATPQGSYAQSMLTYPTGLQEMSADNLHSATYSPGSLEVGGALLQDRFTDNYTNVTLFRGGLSKTGYSFVIGIIAVFMSYLLAIPLGTVMALRKDKLVDKLGTFYIVFITAVPSLAYIFMFKAIGGKMGLPTTFDMDNPTWMMYVLPVISLALPSVAGLMKWLRRYMIDQMNSDYVKFARSGGLAEGEIFSKHVLKNAIIPIVHGIPGSVLGALTGALITERVYVVPGAGYLLTEAINFYDNGVIVGMTMFFAVLSVTSIILGDVLMSMMDPRISFTTKAR